MSGPNEAPLDLTNEPLLVKHAKKKLKLLATSQQQAQSAAPTVLTMTTSTKCVPQMSIVSAEGEANNGNNAGAPIQLVPPILSQPLQVKSKDVPTTSSQTEKKAKPKPVSAQTNKVSPVKANVEMEPKTKKRKLDPEDNPNNPLQRGKYGLRPLPQQVDYYQSVLEERKAKIIKDSVKQFKDTPEPVVVAPVAVPVTTPKKDRRPNISVRKEPEREVKEKTSANEHFEVGDIVWATLPSYKVWFPALMIAHIHCGQRPPKSGHTWVYWFGDHQVSEIPKSKVKAFIPNFGDLSKGSSGFTSLRMKEALLVLASRASMSFPQNTPTSEDEALIEWAKSGFIVPKQNNIQGKANIFSPDALNPIPALAACYLPLDALYQESLKTDDRLQQIAFYEVESTAETVQELDEPCQIPEYKLSQVERVKKGQIKMTDICIGCCCDFNAAADAVNGGRVHHPLFEGLLCKQCLETMRCTMYAPGDDNKNSFCAVCGQVGNLAVCDNASCHRVYCFVCIDLYVEPTAHSKIVDAQSWECYLCRSDSLTQSCLLKTKSNWRENVKSMFDPIRPFLPGNISASTGKQPIRVLSLFDGIGSTKLALDKLGLQIDAFYASEADRDAVSVTKRKMESSVVFLDKVESITLERIASICPDLVIGGSPCNETSATGSSRKALLDNKGIGHHFLYFNHILQLARLTNKDRHVFFLFQCMVPSQFSFRDVISDLLMCKPVTLNIKELSLLNKSCYFWSNIPGINRPLPQDLQDRFLRLVRVGSTLQRKSTSEHPAGHSKSIDEVPTKDIVSVAQLEVLSGFEENHTDINGLPKSKRQTLLAKSWPVPVLSHVLWALSEFFKTK